MADPPSKTKNSLTRRGPSESQRQASLERMHVREMDVNEIISRMNQLRQRGPDGNVGNLTSPIDFTPRLIRETMSPILGARVNFHPEFRRLGFAVPKDEPMVLQAIPSGCARSEVALPAPRPRAPASAPPPPAYPPMIYVFPPGDGVEPPHYKWLTGENPMNRTSRYSNLPRHPFGLSVASAYLRPIATRKFLVSEFGLIQKNENYPLKRAPKKEDAVVEDSAKPDQLKKTAKKKKSKKKRACGKNKQQ